LPLIVKAIIAWGRPTQEVAQVTGYSRSWIYELVRGYNHLGLDAIGGKRRHNAGAKPLLDAFQQVQLWQVLQHTPIDGDLWDGLKVAQWMSELLRRSSPTGVGLSAKPGDAVTSSPPTAQG
jgi:transposase